MTTYTSLESYLEALGSAMKVLPATEREEFLREIRAHVAERLAEGGHLAAILQNLGDPRILAREYCDAYSLRRARRSFSPWFLFRLAWRWSLAGVRGMITFLVAFTGYSVGFAAFLTVLVKLILPTRVGLWIGDFGMVWGIPPEGVTGYELLGNWFALVTMMVGVVAIIVTTVVLRQVLPTVLRRRLPLAL